MTPKIRAKSEIKLNNGATWQFQKGQSLVSVISDLIKYNNIDSEEDRNKIRDALNKPAT
jgi:hypothetical protein